MVFSKMLLFWLILVRLLPLSGHAEQQDIKLSPSQVYTNELSRFQFPPTVAGFLRGPTLTQYDEAGRDTSVGYNDLSNSIAATVYVYPTAQCPPDNTLTGHFGSCKAEVMAAHNGAKLESEGKIQITPGGVRHDGWHATFTFTDNFMRLRQSVRSEVYLFTHQKAFVLFRITYPAGATSSAEPAIKSFLDSLVWP